MRVVLDTNIWVDIAARPTTFPESALLVRKLESHSASLCFPLCAYTTVYYLLSKILSVNAAQEFIQTLYFRRTQFLSFGIREVSKAWELDFKDHEDACIAASAALHTADLIVTRDKAGFKKSPVKTISPGLLLKQLS